MKRRNMAALLGLLVLASAAVPDDMSGFLERWFSGAAYDTDAYCVGGRSVWFSYSYAESRRGIVSKAVIYETRGDTVLPLLVFDENVIRNSRGILLSATPPANHVFFGWEIEIDEASGGVSTAFYTNGGLSVTDGPSFVWDDCAHVYRKYEIDPNML
ncbi:MAG TPA: hypothetical protein IAA30_00135 [Candidatus Treponema faecavium]|nr:hypothetical protein [Candidatus Treponema faecavium]